MWGGSLNPFIKKLAFKGIFDKCSSIAFFFNLVGDLSSKCSTDLNMVKLRLLNTGQNVQQFSFIPNFHYVWEHLYDHWCFNIVSRIIFNNK